MILYQLQLKRNNINKRMGHYLELFKVRIIILSLIIKIKKVNLQLILQINSKNSRNSQLNLNNPINLLQSKITKYFSLNFLK